VPDDCRRVSGIAAGIGVVAGISFIGVVEVLSRTWNSSFVYNQHLLGPGIAQMYVSLLLVPLVAGFLTAYLADTSMRRIRILSAALAGAVAAITARILPFILNPAYLVPSLLATWFQVLLLISGAMLMAAFGGLVASFLDKERSKVARDILPVAGVFIAVIVAPPLLAIAGIATGIIPPAPYSGGPPATNTDIWILKVSAAGDIEREARVNISAYDKLDALAEYPDGYAVVLTDDGQEGNKAHIYQYDEREDACGRSIVATEFGRITALVPVPEGGFLMATRTPGLIRIGPDGGLLWKESFANESRSMAPVSLLALDGGRHIAVWEDTAACFAENGTRLWKASLNTGDEIGFTPLYQAADGGVLAFPQVRDQNRTLLQAVLLDCNGTVLWRHEFGRGVYNKLLDARISSPGEYRVFYRSTTFPEDLRGSVTPTHQGYIFTLDENGGVTEDRMIPDDGEVVIPSSAGYLSVITGESEITLVLRNTAGGEVWPREWAVKTGRPSIIGIGTADGGYLIAGSTSP